MLCSHSENAAVHWFSKKQTSVETSTFGSEMMAMGKQESISEAYNTSY